MLPSLEQRSLGEREEHSGIETLHSPRLRPMWPRPKAVRTEGGGRNRFGDQESNTDKEEAGDQRLGEASTRSAPRKSDAGIEKKIRVAPAPADFPIAGTIHRGL